ncbi:MAG: GH39 family glycosyl hydrolase [Limisphaerales bacterium]
MHLQRRFCFPLLFGLLFDLAMSRAAAAPVPAPATPGGAAGEGEFPVSIHVDAAHPKQPLKPIWRFFGADEPNYATRKNGQKLIGELGALSPQKVYFRAHNLLTSGDGTPALKWGSTGVYSEDADGHPVYRWKIIDGILDTYIGRGVRPYVEIGFMPRDLSVKPDPYQHHWTPQARYEEIFTGWAYPPKDYQKWEDLVFSWVRHCVEKYGRAEVETWYWEVWNEANIGYWRGTPDEFLKLHDYAIAGVRRALPTARVGGADTAGSGGKFTRMFLEHCLRGTNYATGRVGTPLDFISFHAKGAPKYVEGHVRMGIANQLRTLEEGFKLVTSFPELRDKPIIIGESDPEGCAACQGPSLAYRNGTMYSSYTAAVFARHWELAERLGVNLEGALTWAFEFEDQPYFAGFRSLASNGLDKPVLNVFRMFSHMNGRFLQVSGDHSVPIDTMLKEGVRAQHDVSALASLGEHKLCVILWHYHDDDVPGPEAVVDLSVSGLPLTPRAGECRHFVIDADHSNAFHAWQRMRSTQNPTPEQYLELERAGQLATVPPPSGSQPENGQIHLALRLPRQAVSLLEWTW